MLPGNSFPTPLSSQSPSVINSPNQTTTIGCISLNSTNVIHLLEIPKSILSALTLAIKYSWPPGIQHEEDLGETSYEYTLEGNPWTGLSSEAVYSRQLLTSILKTMLTHGWKLLTCIDISTRSSDKNIFYFEYDTKHLLLPKPEMFTISFHKANIIRLIEAPEEIKNLIRETIERKWRFKIQSERSFHGAWEFHLLGNPWRVSPRTITPAKLLIAQILACIRENRYQLYASLEIVKISERTDSQSWVFWKEESWFS